MPTTRSRKRKSDVGVAEKEQENAPANRFGFKRRRPPASKLKKPSGRSLKRSSAAESAKAAPAQATVTVPDTTPAPAPGVAPSVPAAPSVRPSGGREIPALRQEILEAVLERSDAVAKSRLGKFKKYDLKGKNEAMKPMLKESKLALREMITAVESFASRANDVEARLAERVGASDAAYQASAAENFRLNTDLDETREKVASHERDLALAAQAVETLERKVAGLEENVDETTTKLAAETEGRTQAEARGVELAASLAAVEEKVGALESGRAADLKEHAEALEVLKTRHAEETKAAEESAGQAKTALWEQLGEQRRLASALGAEKERLEARARESAQQIKETSRRLKEESEKASQAGAEVARLGAELKAAEARAAERAEQLKKAEESGASRERYAEKRIDRLSTEKQRAEAEARDLTARLAAAEAAGRGSTEAAAEAQRRLEEIQQRLASTEQRLAVAETEHRTAAQRLEELQTKHAQLEEQHAQTCAQLEETRSRAADDAAVARADVQEKAEEIAKGSARAAELEAERRALTQRLERLEDAHRTTSNELKTLRLNHSVDKDEQLKRLLDMVKENESLRAIKSGLETSLAGASAEASSASELRQRLQKSEAARRRLHNRVQELRGNIRVFVRVRPFLGDEAEELSAPGIRGPPVCCKGDGQGVRVTNPSMESGASATGCAKPKAEHHTFNFDRVFGESAGQADVFKEVTELVQSALDGHNVCIFSYGQTGSGKTYTMQGDGRDGLIPQSVRQVVGAADDLRRQGWEYALEGTFLEIHNEQIRDLLRPGAENVSGGRSGARGRKGGVEKVLHAIKTDSDGHKTVTALRHVPLRRAEEVHALMETANAARAVSSTDMNDQSSRSHSVFTLHLRGTHAESGTSLRGALHLVDLAGSERLSRSGATGAALKETQAINKSLSCLGDIFLALREKRGHVPYRNSKLTYLLQECFSRDGKTLMLVNVSPTPRSYHETLCSLRFAQKVNQCELGQARANVSRASKKKAAPNARRDGAGKRRRAH
jgi:kinesin family protein C1